jgi:mannose-6-phosphate isomerase
LGRPSSGKNRSPAAAPGNDRRELGNCFAGRPLTDLHGELGLALIGRHNNWAQERGKFPLLVKLLDANRPLSVQVHPDDDYALTHEGNELGKTEMWVILHAEPGASVILGVAPDTTPDAFRRGIQEGHLEPFLHHIPVRTGDHICVPAGSLHAIMGGLLIAEIQQNSNTTYRVYDWNRVGADGRPRPLHIDKALDVINFAQVAPSLSASQPLDAGEGIRRALLCRNQYFTTERIEIEAGAGFHGDCNGDSLEIWGVIDGTAMVNDVEITAVRFTLLPASLGAFTISAQTPVALLRTYVG